MKNDIFEKLSKNKDFLEIINEVCSREHKDELFRVVEPKIDVLLLGLLNATKDDPTKIIASLRVMNDVGKTMGMCAMLRGQSEYQNKTDEELLRLAKDDLKTGAIRNEFKRKFSYGDING